MIGQQQQMNDAGVKPQAPAGSNTGLVAVCHGHAVIVSEKCNYLIRFVIVIVISSLSETHPILVTLRRFDCKNDTSEKQICMVHINVYGVAVSVSSDRATKC